MRFRMDGLRATVVDSLTLRELWRFCGQRIAGRLFVPLRCFGVFAF